MKNSGIIFTSAILILLILTIFSVEARSYFLPQMITIQNSEFDIIGYIDMDGAVMDANYNLAGYIRQEGRIEGKNGFSIGYFDGSRFTDMNMNNLAYFNAGRVENSGFYTVGHIGMGTIEGPDFLIRGYFMGDTGGRDWVIAAFCIYYTDMFTYASEAEPDEKEEPEIRDEKKYRIFTEIELNNEKEIVIELFSDLAPETCLRFITLAEEGFYDNLEFFEISEGLYARSGCPNNDGTGKSSYKDLSVEENDEFSIRDGGLIIMYQGKFGKEEPNCQFLLTTEPVREMKSSNYTIFGKIVEGLDTVKELEGGEVIKNINIIERND